MKKEMIFQMSLPHEEVEWERKEKVEEHYPYNAVDSTKVYRTHFRSRKPT